MTQPANLTFDTSRELSLTRLLDAPRAAIWRCWTESDLLMQWFCPKPWSVIISEIDLRPGGASTTTMSGPNGEIIPTQGIYLEVVPQQRLVFTDAFTQAWLPSQKAFIVGTIEMADESGKTRYTATVRHWSSEDREAHEKMGFHEGWGIATQQLEALAKTL
jgi:uncharacterized protein YndB with AHSA1/START domain